MSLTIKSWVPQWFCVKTFCESIFTTMVSCKIEQVPNVLTGCALWWTDFKIMWRHSPGWATMAGMGYIPWSDVARVYIALFDHNAHTPWLRLAKLSMYQVMLWLVVHFDDLIEQIMWGHSSDWASMAGTGYHALMWPECI